MLRIYDARTGQPEPVRPARPGWLHTYLASPADASRVQADDLRSALLADLIRRIAERHNLVVSAWQWEPQDTAADAAAGEAAGPVTLRAACGALNIHPAQPAQQPPELLDVVISAQPEGGRPTGRAPGDQDATTGNGDGATGERTAGEREPRDAGRAHWVWPAGVVAGEVLPETLVARGLDPLALRLALLYHHHRQPIRLGWEDLAAADRALRGWRGQVAQWAQSPSKPMCAQYVADVTGAMDADLDTPAALSALSALASDATVPSGSKFEAFAYLDRLLGLDLASEVGR